MSRFCTYAAVLAAILVSPRAAAQCQYEWKPLAQGLSNIGNALAVVDEDLFVGLGNGEVKRWNGETWQSLSTLNGPVYTMNVLGNQLLVGGAFLYNGPGGYLKNIGWWDGTNWRNFGPGLNGTVRAIWPSYNSNLICGGDFTARGDGVGPVQEIAFLWESWWWTQLGSGLNGIYPGIGGVSALIMYDDSLIAGGGFTSSYSPSIPLLGIAQLDGNGWEPLGTGMTGTFGEAKAVKTLAVFGGELIAGGNFAYAGGVACNRIAAWNGTSWRPLGTGMDGNVNALTVHDGYLIAGGSFSNAGGVPCSRIAHWDGYAWQALGSGMSGTVNTLGVYDGDLIAAGSFSMAGGVTVNRIARWTLAEPLDSDCDGLLDDWESNGIPYTKSDGSTGHYVLPGANPYQKDVYVEIDAMVDRVPIPNALVRVKNAFNQAGINLHILGGSGNGADVMSVDETDLPLADYFDPANPSVSPFSYFQYDKAIHFGFNTPDERGDMANWPAIRQAKAKAFRYCIFGNSCSADGKTVGLAEVTLCNDFMVTLGGIHATSPTVPNLEDHQAATFMHELGHSLGLRHGGDKGDDYSKVEDDRWNYKPNYFSVMNYTWSSPSKYLGTAGPVGRRYRDFFPNFSNGAVPALDENALYEPLGIQGSVAVLKVPHSIPVGAQNCRSHNICAILPSDPCRQLASFVGPVDWDNDPSCESQSPSTVQVNINAIFESDAITTLDNLKDHDDWHNLRFSFLASPAFADDYIAGNVASEFNTDIIEMMQSGPAPDDMLGDMNCDGAVDIADITPFVLALIDPPQYQVSNPDCYLTYGDLDFDGEVNGKDIPLFVAKLLGQ